MVADHEDGKIYAYDLRTKERRENLDFNTLGAAGNANPIGIWSDWGDMWVLDVEDRRVYAYHTESQGPVTRPRNSISGIISRIPM